MGEAMRTIGPEGEHTRSQMRGEVADNKNLEAEVGAYLAELQSPFIEITDDDVDKILSRFIEKGPEYSPDTKVSLRKTISMLLMQRVAEKKRNNA